MIAKVTSNSSLINVTSIDNKIEDFNVVNLRRQIGYVPQDVFLFSDTIENNILFGAKNKTFNHVVEAAENADLTRNIQTFPDEYKTMVGERGITLSGGQKQRISIARAIIKKPKILILDDCLSAVDTKTENKILENLKTIMLDKTTIIISHRISSVKLAKKILVMDEGKVIEEGNHQDLLKKRGEYYKIYKNQIEEEKIN